MSDLQHRGAKLSLRVENLEQFEAAAEIVHGQVAPLGVQPCVLARVLRRDPSGGVNRKQAGDE